MEPYKRVHPYINQILIHEQMSHEDVLAIINDMTYDSFME